MREAVLARLGALFADREHNSQELGLGRGSEESQQHRLMSEGALEWPGSEHPRSVPLANHHHPPALPLLQEPWRCCTPGLVAGFGGGSDFAIDDMLSGVSYDDEILIYSCRHVLVGGGVGKFA